MLSFTFLIYLVYMIGKHIVTTLKQAKLAYLKHQLKKQSRMNKYKRTVTRMTKPPLEEDKVVIQKSHTNVPASRYLTTDFNILSKIATPLPAT